MSFVAGRRLFVAQLCNGSLERDGTRRGTVYVLREGRPRAVPVRIGLVDDTVTEVVGEGLGAGVQVVTDEIDTSASTTPTSQPGAIGAPSGGSRRGMR